LPTSREDLALIWPSKESATRPLRGALAASNALSVPQSAPNKPTSGFRSLPVADIVANALIDRSNIAGALVLVAGALVLVAGAFVLVAGAFVLVAGALFVHSASLVMGTNSVRSIAIAGVVIPGPLVVVSVGSAGFDLDPQEVEARFKAGQLLVQFCETIALRGEVGWGAADQESERCEKGDRLGHGGFLYGVYCSLSVVVECIQIK